MKDKGHLHCNERSPHTGMICGASVKDEKRQEQKCKNIFCCVSFYLLLFTSYFSLFRL